MKLKLWSFPKLWKLQNGNELKFEGSFVTFDGETLLNFPEPMTLLNVTISMYSFSSVPRISKSLLEE